MIEPSKSPSVTLIDLDRNVSCTGILPNYPISGNGKVMGDVLSPYNVFMSCGGCLSLDCYESDNSCFYLDLHSPKMEFVPFTPSLVLDQRSGESGIAIDDQTIWINGGRPFLNTTKLLSLQGTREGPNLPFLIADHCMVKVGSHLAIIGGRLGTHGDYGEGVTTNQVHFYDFETEEWTVGPNLTWARYDHACTTYEINGTEYIMVLGGYGWPRLDVEFLDPQTLDKWLAGI